MSENNDLSDYEKFRLENIQRNVRRLKELGLDRGFTTDIRTSQPKKVLTKSSKSSFQLLPPRRSGRKRKQVDYREDCRETNGSQQSGTLVVNSDDDEFVLQNEADDTDANPIRSKRICVQNNKGEEKIDDVAENDSIVQDPHGGLTCEMAAKSGRSTCRKCKTKIEKGAPRVGMHAWIVGRNAITWQCPDCFLGNLITGYEVSGRSRCKATHELFVEGELKVGARSHTATSYFKMHALHGVLQNVISLVTTSGLKIVLPSVGQISGSEDLMKEDCEKLQSLLSSIPQNYEKKADGVNAGKVPQLARTVKRRSKNSGLSREQPRSGTIAFATGKVEWKFGGHTCYGTLLPKEETKTHCFARTHKGNTKTLSKGKEYWSLV
uniref:PARP-type domain-containing protein n=1 Tax=Odontella aurita TaxID=265563 RepID=A0A7S4IT60_9STRA|mmetsp:Transcript_29959/g.89120  ORF Transcript_29959/g.89120 Transcript_29959/m.89120 type:complete len:379 (+) Transcript_29959:313-1449(+)